ncbi:lipase 1-like [Plodia interpunctella]|uniref:lipase 1-like n=1 Tax=Plodia interpunctella TaxID=58824 RepID=UPI0023688DB2|nr:lipase 1-like [Plodia interpunctella]
MYRLFSFIVFAIILQDSTCIQRKNLGRSIGLKDSELNFSQLARKYGYLSEKHTVITEDGYILTNFRMRARQCEGKRPPVLVMHGLLMSSDSYLDAGPRAGLAYLLADACYDVWVGNYRGNYYSRAHVTLNPDKDADYWNFSYDQMGYYDIPGIIDYILKTTGYETLSYIGYSQGAATGYIMCSERPGYCDKMNLFINLAPSTRHINSKSRASRRLALTFMKHERKFDRAGIHEVLGKPERIPDFISFFCNLSVGEPLCRSALILLDSYHARSLPRSTVKTLFGHFSAGTSVHNMAQYGQAMLSDEFQKFDYGPSNIKVYGTKEAPSYNLGATTAPVLLIYGQHDGMVDPKDARWLASKLPNLVEAYLVPDKKWNHIDFAYSKHVPKMIFPKIQEYLLKYNNNNKLAEDMTEDPNHE